MPAGRSADRLGVIRQKVYAAFMLVLLAMCSIVVGTVVGAVTDDVVLMLIIAAPGIWFMASDYS